MKEAGSGLLFRERVDSLTRGGAKTALQHLRQVLRHSQRKGDRDQIAWSLLNIAMVLRGQRQYPAVIKILEEARGIFTSTTNDFGLASVYEELSFANRELDRNALALEYAHKAVGMFQTLGRTLELAWAYDNMAVIYFNRFHRHESLTYAKRARAIFLEFNSQNGLAWNACNLANLYLEMGFFSRATRFYSEANELFTHLNSKQGRAWSLLGLATVSRAQCQFDAAEGLLEKARELFDELELKDRVGWCLLNLAAIKRMTGAEEDAIALNKRAIQLFGPLRNHDGVAWAFFQIGQIFRDRGQLVKAWQTLREALNLHTDISNRSGMGWAENEMGKTYLEMNDIAHARECFVKAKVTAEQLDAAALKAEVDKNLANLYLDEGMLQKAVELLDKSEAIAQKIKSREIETEVRVARCRYWRIIGDHAKAREAYTDANALVDAYDLRRLKPVMGLLLGELLVVEGKKEDGLQTWQDTAQLAKKMRQRRPRAEALLGILQLQRSSKTPAQLSLALFHIEKDVRAVSSRKLKAKFLLVKGLIAYQTSGFFDPRFITQSLQILASAGLSVLERLVLDTAAETARLAGRDRDLQEFEREIRQLLEKGSADLHLVRLPADQVALLPVSLVC